MANDQTTIFGIDLGTTYSCIAYVDEYGKPIVVPNAEGDLTTPSVVMFDGTHRVVGKEAKNSAVLAPEHVVSMIKRDMGNPDFRSRYDGVDYTPQEISSYILRKLAADTAQQLGRPVTDVVITCPAYFGLAEREATRKAGELAGLNVREIINEPTAAAIDFGFGVQDEHDQVVMVYDLGGGTFDVTIIRITSGEIRVIATGGDHQLGGRDWDEQVVRYLAEEWRQANPEAVTDPLDSPETRQDLWDKAEAAKRALSARGETRVAVAHEGRMASVTLTREQFDELTRGQLEQTIQYTREMLQVAEGKGVHAFDQLLLVGGSTRMPQVKERLTREFPGIEPHMHDPDQSVAKGAAIYGQKLAIGDAIRILIEDDPTLTHDDARAQVALRLGLPSATIITLDEVKIINVVSHSYGVIVVDLRDKQRKFISNLVITQQELPITFTRVYGTSEANQINVRIQVIQNDQREEQVDDLTLGEQIAEATLSLRRPNLPVNSPIEVTSELNEQGLLHVIARDMTDGGTVDIHAHVDVHVQIRGGMSAEEEAAAKERSALLQVC